VDESDAVESINSLTKANKELRAERNALNLQSEAGMKRATEINALLDQNTNKIKTNVSALEKQKINIGNYKSALDGVHPALGKVGQGLEAGTSGLKQMTLQALRFIATPIGAIIAALAAVFTLLKSAISSNNEVLDKFENITNAIGVVMDVIINRVGKLGEALIALVSGDFDKAIDLTGQAFSGLADEIANAVRQGQLYLDLSRELEDSQRALRIETAKTENEIKRLVVASKNRNLSLDEQEDLLRKALALEEQLVSKRAENAQKDLVITAKRLALEKSLSQTAEETFDQFVNRLVTGGKLADEQVDEIVDKIEALEQARGSSLAFQEKLENNLATIQEKRTKILEEQNKVLAEQAAQERAVRRAQNIESTDVEDPLVGAFQTRATLIEDINDKMNKDLAKRNQEFRDEEALRQEKATQLQVQNELAKVQIIGGLAGGLSRLMKEDSEAQRALTSAQALVNTYASAVAAFKSGAEINFAFGVIAAAAAVAAGLANVARINNVQFAEGGFTGVGPKHQPAGIVHAGEVVWSQEDVRRAGGPGRANAMRPTFRGYADGGLVTDTLAAPINQQLALANIVKNIPPGEVSVVEIAKVSKRVEVKQKISKR
jgi:hypothetical protein